MVEHLVAFKMMVAQGAQGTTCHVCGGKFERMDQIRENSFLCAANPRIANVIPSSGNLNGNLNNLEVG